MQCRVVEAGGGELEMSPQDLWSPQWGTLSKKNSGRRRKNGERRIGEKSSQYEEAKYTSSFTRTRDKLR